jgi:hypothetical protein
MLCQGCGVEAPTRQVAFYQNIGALVMRYSSKVEGKLCKSCIHKHFWKMTAVNLTLGWWGTISLIMTPCFLINNLGHYMVCLFMPSSRGAQRPQLSSEAVARLGPHTEEIIRRLNAGEKAADLMSDVSQRAGVTPGQVALYIQELVRASRRAAK